MYILSVTLIKKFLNCNDFYQINIHHRTKYIQQCSSNFDGFLVLTQNGMVQLKKKKKTCTPVKYCGHTTNKTNEMVLKPSNRLKTR